MKIYQGDCIEVLKKLKENSIDTVICDPPYGIGFMGKEWDTFKPGDVKKSVENSNRNNKEKDGMASASGIRYDESVPGHIRFEKWFKEVSIEMLRVAKPGATLMICGSPRVYHRMACAIEDAGWILKDCIMWLYGCLSEDTEVLTKKGFKLLHKTTKYDTIRIYDITNNIYKWETPERWSVYRVHEDTCYRIKSDTTDQIVSKEHRCLVERKGKLVFKEAWELSKMERVPILPKDFYSLEKGNRLLLLKELLWKSKGLAKTIFSKWEGKEMSSKRNERREKSSLERRYNLQEEKRTLCKSIYKVCSLSKGIFKYVQKRRLCNGASYTCCKGNQQIITKNGMCSSHKSQCRGQQNRKSDVIQNKRGTQKIRTQSGYNTTLATISKIKYTGKLFCPTVSTGSFIARRNGKIFITGNSGFPKATDISKQLDKGHKRKVVGQKKGQGNIPNDRGKWGLEPNKSVDITEPSTPEAKLWNGWKSHGLKPAYEPIIVAMKPNEGTYAQNALKHGVSGLNIDGGRIGITSESDLKKVKSGQTNKNKGKTDLSTTGNCLKQGTTWKPEDNTTQGRFPANIILDEEAGKMLDEQSGESQSSTKDCVDDVSSNISTFGASSQRKVTRHSDKGGASRFFRIIEVDEDYSFMLQLDICGLTLENQRVAIILNGVKKEIEKYTLGVEQFLCGKKKTENFQKDIVFIIKMVIKQMTELRTLNVLPENHILNFTQESEKTIRLLKELSVENVRDAENINHLIVFKNEVRQLIKDIVKNVLKKNSESGEVKTGKGTMNTTDNIAKRFFYCAKASKAERNAGCEGLEEKKANKNGEGLGRECSLEKRKIENEDDLIRMKNNHPTVKPLKLMEYLCLLTKTPTGGIVLDPFMGSGTTGIAAINTGRDFIGIEKEAEYIKIAKARIKHAQDKPKQKTLL